MITKRERILLDELNAAPGVSPAWALLYRRWSLPKRQWSFWIFLFVGIVVLGGLAVWIELYRYIFSPAEHGKQADIGAVRLALATAGLAVGGPAAMQLLYSRDKLAIVIAILLFTFVMIAAMFLMTFGEPAGCGTFIAGLVCVAPSILAWMLANGEDPIFQDEVPDDAPGGGQPMKALPSVKAPVRT